MKARGPYRSEQHIEALISVAGGRQSKELNLQSRVAEQVTLSNEADLLCKAEAWCGKTGTRMPGLMLLRISKAQILQTPLPYSSGPISLRFP